MKNPKFLIAILLCAFGYLVASCSTTPKPEIYPTLTPRPLPGWLLKFIKNPTCSPPCWENIVPGETTLEQAKLLLARQPDVQDSYVEDTIPFGKTLLWLNGSAPVDDENIVQMVWLRTSFYGVLLDQIVNRYGDPKYVVFSYWYENRVSVDLLYPDIGLVISTRQYEKGHEPDNVMADISPKDEVADILFLAPGLEYYYAKMIWGLPLMQYDWKGYQTYP